MLDGLEKLLDKTEERFGSLGRYLVSATLLVAIGTFILFCLDIAGDIAMKWAQEPYRSGIVFLLFNYGVIYVLAAGIATPVVILWWFFRKRGK